MSSHPKPRGWTGVTPERLAQMRKLNGTWGVHGMFPPQPFEIEWLIEQAERAERLEAALDTLAAEKKDLCKHANDVLRPNIKLLKERRDELKAEVEKKLQEFKNDILKPYSGKTLTEVAALRGQDPLEAALDLIIEDDSRVGTVYFIMSEENIAKKIAQPWVSFCSDSESMRPEGVFLKSNPHPRAYGNFARLLGRYVRDEGLIPLEEAVRKLSGFTKPSRANEEAFDRAVDQVSQVAMELLGSLVTNAPSRNREEEARKARERAEKRFGPRAS